MRKVRPLSVLAHSITVAVAAVLAFSGPASPAVSQEFDFERLDRVVRSFSVIIDMKIELSFGMHNNEVEQRLLGTVVSPDGLVVFDGSDLAQDNAFSAMSGLEVKTSPTRIEVRTFDDETFEAEFLGTDRFTRLGFARIMNAEGRTFEYVRFADARHFNVGDWLAVYMLLPEFVSPSLSADVGMVSALIKTPEPFTLTVGFSSLELASVLFDQHLKPVGVLGALMNPATADADASGLIESFGEFNIPLLGVIPGERLEQLIADPPRRGKIDRAWLGISLQALTDDIADFLDIDAGGGIIVNDVIKGSPADKAGIAVGDVIYEINGQPVEVNREERLALFQRRIAEMGPGTSVEFSVYRPNGDGNDTLNILAVLDSAPISPSEAPDLESEDLEFKVRNLVFADYARFNKNQDDFNGVVVSELQRGGLATLGGLEIGDVIQRIGNSPVSNVEDVGRILTQLRTEKPEEVIFFVWRNNKTMFVNVKTDW
jgi:serine protease Do